MDNRSVAYLFPGQGSQVVGMGFDFTSTFPTAKTIFQKADHILGFSISQIAWDGPEKDLNDTLYTQPALLADSIATLYVIEEQFPQLKPSFVAGHSMGELSSLVASRASSFKDTLQLSYKRGELMKLAGERSPGKMAAILGLDIAEVEKICSEVIKHGDVLQIANDNCPGQVVISGSETAIDLAIKLAQAAGAKKIQTLNVSIAAHSPIMSSVQNEYNIAVNSISITAPKTPIIGNVNALPLDTDASIRNDLQEQLTSKVRWTESIQYMINTGINTFIEIGGKGILTGLLKRIDKNVIGLSISNIADLSKLEIF